MRLTSRALAATAAAAAIVTLAAGTASAEPAFDPGINDVVGVGSDTTELYLQSAADTFNVGLTSDDIRLVSFDATPPGDIVIRPGKTIPRPNGSSSGITALKNTPEIDFARSSRGKTASDAGLDFVIFAQDGQKYATATTSNVPDGLTAAQLKEIYTCSSAAVPGLKPKLPQPGSGSRAFFLSQIGVTDAQATAAPCITVVQENDPAAVAGDPAALVPFSVGRFGAGQPGIKLNTTGYSVTRPLFNVVRSGAVAASPTLRSVFGTVDEGGFLCNNPQIITSAGFQTVPNCGAIS